MAVLPIRITGDPVLHSPALPVETIDDDLRALEQGLPRTSRERRSMANSAQAKKRARQAEVTRQRNASLKSALRTAVKKVKKAIAKGDKSAATSQLQASQAVIDLA
mgnify:CR=1 FL=1